MAWGDVSDWAQMAVALAAIGFAWWEAKESRKDRRIDRQIFAADLRLRARPKLSLTWDVNAASARIHARLRNVGLGPAIIRSVDYTYRGERFTDLTNQRIVAICNAVGFYFADASHHLGSIADGTVIPSGESICVLALERIHAEFTGTLNEIPRALTIGALYESIYGEVIDER